MENSIENVLLIKKYNKKKHVSFYLKKESYMYLKKLFSIKIDDKIL